VIATKQSVLTITHILQFSDNVQYASHEGSPEEPGPKTTWVGQPSHLEIAAPFTSSRSLLLNLLIVFILLKF